jgi:hypothetical protein
LKQASSARFGLGWGNFLWPALDLELRVDYDCGMFETASFELMGESSSCSGQHRLSKKFA